MNKRMWVKGCGALLLAITLAGAAAQADDHHDHGGPQGGFGERGGHFERGGLSQHMDGRYSHNQYYPDRGRMVRGLPGSSIAFNRPNGRYFYSGGVWYAPRGPGYVVIGAPIGCFVPFLPAYYTTLWIGGFPYYYANETYYTWDQTQNGYEVVAPPNDQGATTEAPQPPPPQGDQLYIYPQNGQSEQQQATDKYECHKWASSQAGFDPTQPSGGVPPEQFDSQRADYHRAMSACLQGRGYSAR
ncbi:MAG: DUF6515 family protein [Steroidobacterales bacterium]|jgi:hypothetical protein